MPAPSYVHKVAAGIAILFGGLSLIVIGGCFLIGVMLITNRGFNSTMAGQPLGNSALVLVIVLYTLAACAFVAAVSVISVGVKSLLGVLRG